ncbi:myocardin-related transcription factor A-like [Xyrichtys novacula]|nr:myocardin-related transcription factor A-like [Xyrichtys novacula]
MAPSDQRAFVTAQSKPQLKSNSDCSAQKEKKLKDDKPKMKKLKYHQYVPPDQKGVKEPSAHLDSSYAKMVHQQQLVLQLQIINQQQQNYHAILPATAKPQSDQQSSSSSSSDSTTSSSSLSPVSASSNQESQKHQGSAPRMEIKPASLPPNLHEMKVAELKSELRLRSLPVSGTKTDLIERLKTYQDLKGGSDTTASSTAGGTTGLMAREAGKPSKTAATTTIIINNNTSQRQQQHHRHRYQIDQSGRSDTTASFSPTSVSLTSSDCSSGSLSPVETGFKCDQTKETMSSPHTQLSLQACSAALFPANIKKEQMCSTSAPCQFFLKPACLQKRCPVSSAGTNAMKKAPVVTMDKDEMLKEKDKQIEELSKMLRQIQRVVELLKMQLERGKRERKVPEPLVFVRVKQEPPDEPSDPLLFHDQPSTPSPSFPCGIEVKQEGRAAEEVVSVPDAHEFTQTLTQTREVQEQIHLKIQPDQTNTVTKHLHLQQTTQRSSQHQAVQRHLLQQRHNSMSWEQLFQNCSQMLDNQPNLQKLPEEKKKSHKQQQQQLSRQRHQQLKQQISPKQQEENKQRTQQQQVLTKTQPQQQQVLQLPSQVPEANFDQQSGSPSLFSPFKKDSSPSGNIPLLVKTGGLQVSVDQSQHEVALPLSTPKPVSKEISVTGMNTFLSSSTNNEMCLNMDILSGPTAQTSMKTWESSPHNKVGELTNGFIDSILQTGGPSQDSPDSDPSISPCLYPPQSSPSAQPEFRTLEDTTKEKQDISHGRLEDFLESTMGNPLLGVEPGCTLTLIDDLHSQMLCTPSILDHPSSPMDTFDKAAKEEQGLDSMDWLDFDVGGLKGSEAMTLDPLGPHTPPGVFSTDFLDSSDLQVQWDSCF